jgi:TolB protein
MRAINARIWIRRTALSAFPSGAFVATVCAVAAPMAAPASAAVSGHNGRIVFERLVGPNFTSQIATVDPAGRDLRRLTDFNAGAGEPAWSPGGGRIVFSHHFKDGRPGALFSMRAGGENRTRVSHGCAGQCLEDYEPSYSPDGTQIVFSRAFGPVVDDNASEIDLMVIRRNGTHIRTIKRFRLNGRNLEPHSAVWSPNGERLALMLLDATSPAMKSAIFTLELDTGDLDRLTPFHLNAGNPDWSPNGARILFNSNFEGQAAANLFTVDPDGSRLRQLTDNPRGRSFFEPAWSPTGRQIAFVAASTHVPPHIVKMRVGGQDKHRVTSAARPGVHPDWGGRP